MPGPRDLSPTIIAFEHGLVRGGLVILPRPRDIDKQSQILRFQYNPESITRSRTGEWDTQPKEAAGRGAQRNRSGRASGAQAGAGLFAKSETLSLKIVFDATEAILKAPATSATGKSDAYVQGVLPELAVLELASLGGEPKEEQAGNGSGTGGGTGGATTPGVPNNDAHPKEMLLVLGSRYFPVVITSMTITEKRFTPDLVPIRAEVDLQMRVVEAREVKGNLFVEGAFKNLLDRRNDAAALATSAGPLIDTTRDQFATESTGANSLTKAIQDALTVAPPAAFAGAFDTGTTS